MKKNPNLLWITAIALGWLFDLLFWEQSFGINFAIFTVLCLVGGFLLLWINHQHPARDIMVNPVDFIFRSYRFHPRRTDDSFPRHRVYAVPDGRIGEHLPWRTLD